MIPIFSEDYGYDERVAALAAEFPELFPARIISQEKGLYKIVSEHGEKYARITGKFRYEVKTAADYPAVGDFVVVDYADEDTALIHNVLPRKSVFVRKAAGTANIEQVVAVNIDTIFICMSLNLNFNLRRLERYLSIAWNSGAKPVVVLTKMDLCDDINKKLNEVENVAFGVDIINVSTIQEDGYTSILPYIRPGQTVSFIGSSGVGKSTLINCLTGSDMLETAEIGNDDEGRHTTTHRELVLLPNGGIAIDTPGMRELGMWDTEAGIETTFADIEELAESCKYQNCTHTVEPGCAVKAALTNGKIDEHRFLSYLKLKQENAYSLNSESYLAAKEKKFKQISKINKANRQ